MNAALIDLHCHFLPGVDDGARTMLEGLALARDAVDDGIGFAMLTPHIHPGRYDSDIHALTAVFRRFSAAVRHAGIPLRLGLAAEVRLTDELPAQVRARQVPYLGRWDGERVLLLEMPHSHIPPGTTALVYWLRSRGIRPLIAHPERNRDILRSLDKLDPLLEAGCLLQVTAGALCGRFGDRPERRARQLVKRGLVTVLATDAHHRVRRPPLLQEGRAAAEKLVGAEHARMLVRDNPARILSGGLSQSRPVPPGPLPGQPHLVTA
ncbi:MULTISPECIES: tyrosine-protein phosphatase [Microbulbifer]|uniref:tyrosine-protein phosphatase n=1 Tax=Microbulbifer TaxID=48073 RepID=UPI001E611A6C|nr:MULTISPECIES: CpsB/CapC family capsule biosynthesis tyrosine phosphatase [Microbulbifer]UHQ54120.1 capsular biosynthesis protein [Microbulbifer sp. YPW16]